ncbi:hypothetical protein PIB30_087164 [Stylosanthes scabra]|uniref:Aminotransferase-like plant mobile domain-containing protein n=1 Tax=Stylosanthes scabra TaxID=79078 RepID=A0ABU6ZS00_9FABA|nr:hypothetical protein [Stylosanthes scabra]
MFGVVPEDATEIQIRRHAQAYIMLLLSTQLFGDKTAARVPIRLIPFLDQLDDLGQYSWGSAMLAWLAGYSGGFRASDSMALISSDGRWLPGGKGICPHRMRRIRGYSSTGPGLTGLHTTMYADRDIWREENRRLWTSVCTLIYFGTIEWDQVDRVIPQFGGVQNYPHRPLNIDWLHARDGRGGDRWFPTTYQSWHGRWDSRHEQTFTVVEVQNPGPSAGYLRWWFLAARRFLASADAFYPRPPDEIPPEAIQRVADTPVGGNQVDDVPDNRSPGRRRMEPGEASHGWYEDYG